MAPKKKPSMLQRQRQLRSQQQQVKKASSNQLPPKGGSSGNTSQARAQRTGTLKAQAANQQRVIARGMEGFIRRGQAQDKLDKAAKGSTNPGTRTAGAGGGLAKRPSSSVQRRAGTQPSSNGGRMQTPGGRVQRSGSGAASSNRVEQVRVRDLGSTSPSRMGSGTQRALPPGRTGGALTRAGGTARAATSAAAKAGSGILGKLAVPLAMFQEVQDMSSRDRRWNEYKERMGMNKPQAKQAPAEPASKPQQQGPQQTPKMVADYKAKRDARHKALRADMPAPNPRSAGNNSAPARTPRPAGTVPSSSGRSTSAPRTSAPRSQTPPAPRFTGTVDEGRKMWAEKYSSSKYDGQAIQKEAKKLLEKMKKRKEQQSAAQRAGWDGNKNY